MAIKGSDIRETNGVGFAFRLGKYQDVLRPYALSLTKNVDEAQDLVQDTLLKDLTNREKFREDNNLRGWLVTIMKNTFLNQLKRSNRSVSLDPSDESMNQGLLFTVDNAGPSTLNFQEIVGILRRTERDHQKVFLLFMLGYKYREIADELKLPLGTVKVRIHRARKFLKEGLNFD